MVCIWDKTRRIFFLCEHWPASSNLRILKAKVAQCEVRVQGAWQQPSTCSANYEVLCQCDHPQPR